MMRYNETLSVDWLANATQTDCGPNTTTLDVCDFFHKSYAMIAAHLPAGLAPDSNASDLLTLFAPALIVLAIFLLPTIVAQVALSICEILFLRSPAAKEIVLHSRVNLQLPAYIDYPRRWRNFATFFVTTGLTITSISYAVTSIFNEATTLGSSTGVFAQLGFVILGLPVLPAFVILGLMVIAFFAWVRRRLATNSKAAGSNATGPDAAKSDTIYNALPFLQMEVLISTLADVYVVVGCWIVFSSTKNGSMVESRLLMGVGLSLAVTASVTCIVLSLVRGYVEVGIIEAAIAAFEKEKTVAGADQGCFKHEKSRTDEKHMV